MMSNPIDLSAVPDAVLRAERARRNSAKRKVKTGGRNGGRPRTARRCPCGMYTESQLKRRPGHACAENK